MTRRNPGPRMIDLADEEPRTTESDPDANRRRLAAELDLARQELKDAILEATQVSRRVKDLEMALRRAEYRAEQRHPAVR